MSSFGSRFKNLRIQKGYTQEQLVTDFNEKFGYNFTKSAVSQYENDKRLPEINVLIDFASYFNVSVDNLLNGDIIFEKEAEYLSNKGKIDLDEFLEIIKSIIANKEVIVNGQQLTEQELELFYNSIEIGIELIKRNNKKKVL